MTSRLGIDLGGTKVAAVVLGPGDVVAWERRHATPRHDYQGTVNAIAALVRDAERTVGTPCTVGIGTPGTLSSVSGLIKNANSTWLNGRPLKRDLEIVLSREVRLANDANCLILSECVDGAARAAHVAFGVILGTGVGGGLAIDRQALGGANGIAGEWGHNPLPWPEPSERATPCYCGRAGCIETWLSGPALARDYAGRGASPATAEAIVALATAGDPTAQAVVDAWHDRLARALASVINVVDPDVIVVGGGLSHITSVYDVVPARLTRWVFSDQVVTRVVPAVHGDASGVRGAARLWPT